MLGAECWDGRAKARHTSVPSMFDSWEVRVLCPAWWRRRASEAQGAGHREGRSERSVEQRHEPMNKNRILRRERGTSGLVTAKSGSTKSAERKSGGCVPKAIELTSGELCGCLGSGTEGLGREPDRRTEVSRGRSRRQELLKARTVPSKEGKWSGK